MNRSRLHILRAVHGVLKELVGEELTFSRMREMAMFGDDLSLDPAYCLQAIFTLQERRIVCPPQSEAERKEIARFSTVGEILRYAETHYVSQLSKQAIEAAHLLSFVP